jgi:uncharacterized small protein (DUF1192 family)
MKTNKISNLLFIIFLLASVYSFAQQISSSGTAKATQPQTRNSAPAPVQTLATPTMMNYQAVARNSSGAILANQLIGLRLSIEDGPGGTVLYSERQTPTTNIFGLLTVKLGGGTLLSGSWSGINWSGGNQWLKVDMDPTGGSSYTPMGESELLTVPFANVAGTSADNHWSANGGDIYNNNSGGVAIGTTTATNLLTINSPSYWAATQYTTGATGSGSNDGFYVGINSNIGDAAIWNFEAQPIFFGTNSTERMRLNSAGNLGIGTSNPNHMLEVAQGGVNINTNEGNATLYNYGFSNGNALYLESNETGDNTGTTIYSQAQLAGYNSNIPFGGMNAGVWGTVTGNGSAGYGIIGSYGPIGSETNYAGLGGYDYAGQFHGKVYSDGQVNVDRQPPDAVVADANLLITNSNTGPYYPGLGFNDYQSSGVIFYGYGGNIQVGDGAGGWASMNALAFNVMSDVSMKKNVTHLSSSDFNNCLSQIRNIDPITYWYNSENISSNGNKGINRQYPHVGFTAQSLPSTITTSMSEKTGTSATAEKIGFNMSDMIGLSVIGIKALDNRQTQLEKEIADLKAEIQRLKNSR